MGSNLGAPRSLFIKNKMKILRPGERIVYVDEGKTSPQSWTIWYDRESWWDRPPVRHGHGTNFSFADGHAEYWKWEDIRTVQYALDPANNASLASASGNRDIQRVQRGAWGGLGYTPPQP
jgi:prepilin-type processing-associated H-X9-DG protein